MNISTSPRGPRAFAMLYRLPSTPGRSKSIARHPNSHTLDSTAAMARIPGSIALLLRSFAPCASLPMNDAPNDGPSTRAPRLYHDDALHPGATVELPERSARHVQALRLRNGDAVTLFNGDGSQ